jgi:hypothetical protein
VEAERSIRDAAHFDAKADTNSTAGGGWYGYAGLLLARARLAQGDTSGARARLQIALRGLRAGFGEAHPYTRQALALLERMAVDVRQQAGGEVERAAKARR